MTRVSQSMVLMATAVGKLAERELVEVLATVQSFKGVVTATEAVLKLRVGKLVAARGTVVTDKGTKRFVENGWSAETQPTRTGFDPKKVESLLRMRGVRPETAMDSVVTFKVNEGKLADAVKAGVLTEDELEMLRYDIAFRVMVKKVGETGKTESDEDE